MAQLIKCVAHAYETSQQKKSISFNECLFFGKTKSQQLSEEIKDIMDLMKKDDVLNTTTRLHLN